MNNNEQTERERFLHCPACAERLSLVTQILDPRRGKTVRLSAWLRLDQTDPDDRGQMWLSVDRFGDQKGFFDDMSDRAVHTSEWTFREIQARVDDDATFIKFGVMSIGRGRVWVDRVSFTVVSEPGAREQ